jgi:hypothetical protein
MFTTKEAAIALDISQRRVVALIEAGDLTAQRFGRAWMVDEGSVARRLAMPLLSGRPKLGERDPQKLWPLTLMSRNHEVLDFIYNSSNHTVGEVTSSADIAYAPLGVMGAPGHPTPTLATDWLSNRYIPTVRPRLGEVLRELGYEHQVQLLFASYGLNLSDQYWLKPQGAPVDWHSLNYFENGYDDLLGRSMGDASATVSGRSLGYSPSAGTPGMLPKWWERRAGVDYLIKGGDLYNREPYNELLATKLYEVLLDAGDYVPYALELVNDRAFSTCPCFIDATTELVTMHDVMSCYAPEHARYDYRRYLDACRTLGAPAIERQLAKMLVCDFLTANPDRHDRNLGLIREVESLAFTAVAPLFDNGRAFFYAALHPIDLQEGLFFYQSAPFSEYPSTQLALVEDYTWYDPDRLCGFDNVIRETLSANPHLPPALIEAMALQFRRRVARVNEAAREHRPLSISL